MGDRGPGIAKAAFGHEALDLEARRAVVASIVRELDSLVSRHAQLQRRAFTSGTPATGRADLIQADRDGGTDTLRISWNDWEIETIEVEPGSVPRSSPPGEAADPGVVVDALVPMLWKYIRRGGDFPAGIERFAGFFSLR